MVIVNRGHVVKQFARGRALQRPCGAAVNRALNCPRLTDRPAEPIVRERHSQEDGVGRAPQRSRFPIRAAIFAHYQKAPFTPINVALAVEQPIFTQQQPAIGIKEPDVIQGFAPLAFGQSLAEPLRAAVFGRKQRSVATHYPPVIAVNEENAGEFRERAARLRAPFESLTRRGETERQRRGKEERQGDKETGRQGEGVTYFPLPPVSLSPCLLVSLSFHLCGLSNRGALSAVAR